MGLTIDIQHCTECRRHGLQSTIRVYYPDRGYTKVVDSAGLIERDGVVHKHVIRYSELECSCSEGHRWVSKSFTPCTCGWSGTAS